MLHSPGGSACNNFPLRFQTTLTWALRACLLQRQGFLAYELLPGPYKAKQLPFISMHGCVVQSGLPYPDTEKPDVLVDFTQSHSLVLKGTEIIFSPDELHGQMSCEEMLGDLLGRLFRSPVIFIVEAKDGDEEGMRNEGSGDDDYETGSGSEGGLVDRRKQFLPQALLSQSFYRLYWIEECLAFAKELKDSGELKGPLVEALPTFEVRYLPWSFRLPSLAFAAADCPILGLPSLLPFYLPQPSFCFPSPHFHYNFPPMSHAPITRNE